MFDAEVDRCEPLERQIASFIVWKADVACSKICPSTLILTSHTDINKQWKLPRRWKTHQTPPKWDNYRFDPEFTACQTASHVSPRSSHDRASHPQVRLASLNNKPTDVRWHFLDKNKWGPAPCLAVRSPLTKQFKVLRGYFQWLPCALSGSGEKVNEFSTVSHDSRRSGHGEGHSGPPPHADEGMAQRGECHCPLKGEISMCKAPVTQGKNVTFCCRYPEIIYI